MIKYRPLHGETKGDSEQSRFLRLNIELHEADDTAREPFAVGCRVQMYNAESKCVYDAETRMSGAPLLFAQEKQRVLDLLEASEVPDPVPAPEVSEGRTP